jgi:hypothetical protein
MHSFRYGGKGEAYHGLRIVYDSEDTLLDEVGPVLEVVELERDKEMEPSDSFYVLLRRS